MGAANGPFTPPQRSGHARSHSAPGPAAPPQQPHSRPVDATAQLLSAGASSAPHQQHQQRDPFPQSASLRSASSDGAAVSAANGVASRPQPPQPSVVDPFAPKPLAGLGAMSAASRIAATPPAKVGPLPSRLHWASALNAH